MKRFWSKVEKTETCWNWLAGLTNKGHGTFYSKGKTVLAHRFAWELVNGAIPKGEGYHGMCVCHHCDNRLCVNPAHLFLGTQGENMRDMRVKNRADKRPGMKHPLSVLSDEAVVSMRALYSKGAYTQKEIAAMFGVKQQCVSKIVRSQRWKHV